MQKIAGVDDAFLREQAARAAERAARFAVMPDVPPIEPRKRIAWPGGKLVTNRDEALERFLERRPSKEEQAKRLAELRGSGAGERERLRALDAAERDRGAGGADGGGDGGESPGSGDENGNCGDDDDEDDEEISSGDEPESDAEGERGHELPASAPASRASERADGASLGGGVVWRRAAGPPPRRAIDDPDPVALRAGTLVALTGSFADRAGLKALLAASGLRTSALVHRRVSYVVATDRAVRIPTQHVRKARGRGVPVVSEPWLRLCLVLQRQHDAAAAAAAGPQLLRAGDGGAGGSAARAGGKGRAALRQTRLHWRLARHNPWRMLVLLPGWATPGRRPSRGR